MLLSNQFSILLAGYNVRIYAMDLLYDAVYRMYLIGEFEIPKSNINLCLVENALHEVENLKVNLMVFWYYLLLVVKLSTSCLLITNRRISLKNILKGFHPIPLIMRTL
jgi:hypothetical protein